MGIIVSRNERFNNIKLDDINLEENVIIPNDFKIKILQEFILPYYKSNIEYVINEKTIWSRVGTGFLTTSTLLIGAASILSFASSTYPDKNLNFLAGSVGMVALVLKEFASYANSVDHIKTLTLNDLLKNIGLKHTINDSSKNFKKVIQDQKMESQMNTPSPVSNEKESNLDNVLAKYVNKEKKEQKDQKEQNDENDYVDINNYNEKKKAINKRELDIAENNDSNV
jgi:hypothetical protein